MEKARQASHINYYARAALSTTGRVSLYSRRFGMAVLVLGVLLSPNITIHQGIYRPRLEDFLLASVAALFFLSLGSKRNLHRLFALNRDKLLVSKILLLMLFCAVISICVGALAFQQRVIFRDFMIIPMIVRDLLIFLVVGLWIGGKKEEHYFLWLSLTGFGACALAGVFQKYGLFGINSWMTPHYVTQSNVMTGLEMLKMKVEGARVVGTNGDPRHYGFMLVDGIGLCLAVLLTMKSKIMRMAALAVIVCSIMALAFTASRTAILSCLMLVLGVVWLEGKAARGFNKIVGLLMILIVVMALAMPAFNTSTFQDRVLNTHTSSYKDSEHARVRDLVTPFELALESPIIWLTGRGPSKAEVRSNSHNDLGWYFYRFGLPGVSLYIFLVVFLLKMSKRRWLFSKSPMEKAVAMAASLCVINWAVFLMAENIFKDPQLMGLNMLMTGACAGGLRTLPRSLRPNK